MLQLKYLPDESVQSWIYRNIYVSGSFDFSTVIGPKGEWRAYPTFNDDCNFDKNLIEDVDFLAFLRRSGLANKSADFFENPVDYLADIERVFDKRINSLKATSGSRPVRYCRYCIEEVMKEYGFAYFKSCWLSETECSVHSRVLYEINALGRKENEVLIQEILGGIDIPAEFRGKAKKRKVDVTSHNNDIQFHMMPCFQSDLYRWALCERRDYSRGMDDVEFHYPDGRRKSAGKSVFSKAYYFYLYQHPKQFAEFFEATNEIKEYRFGFMQRYTLQEKLLKSKRHNCSKCDLWSKGGLCPIRPITLKHLEPGLSFYNWTNPCDLFMEYQFKMNTQYVIGHSDVSRSDFVGIVCRQISNQAKK
jgi:hypothetical protein